MKAIPVRSWILGGLLILALPGLVHGQVNSWTNTAATGFWHDATKWSLGVAPASTQSRIFITNAVSKTVTINATTAGSFPATMTVSNLVISAPAGSQNQLLVSNAGATPLVVLNVLSNMTGGLLVITNSQLVLSRPGGGSVLRNDGSIVVRDNSTVVVTNASSALIIGNTGTGAFLMTGGTALMTNVFVGTAHQVTFEGTTGTMTMAGGSATLGRLRVGVNEGTGTVWVTGGTLTATNSTQNVGDGTFSAGRIVVSNGTARLADVRLGNALGGLGTLSVHGGVADVFTALTISQNDATGVVAVTGGALIVTNGTGNLIVGDTGFGRLDVSGGFVRSDNLTVANVNGTIGELRMSGGTNLTGFMELASAGSATGTTWVIGGRLESLGSLWLGNGIGQMHVSNGTVVARGLSFRSRPVRAGL